MRLRSQSPSADGVGNIDREHRAVFEHLDRWESRSLLAHEEAEAIRSFERSEVAQAPRVPLIAEVVAYLGAALALAAGVSIVADRWEEITRTQRLTGAAIVAVALLAAGWLLRANEEPAVRRLAGVLWTMSVGAFAGFVGMLLLDPPSGDAEPWALFAVGLLTGGYTAIVRAFQPSTPLVVALYASTLASIGGAGQWAIEGGWTWLDERPEWFGTAMALLSLAWIGAGAARLLEPGGAAIAVGAAGAASAPMLTFESIGYGLLLGVGVAVVLLAGSTWLRNVAMLALGAIALFGYLVGTIVHFFGDSIEVPFLLFLCGVALLVVAVLVARLRRFATPSS
jgi:hypothetical protein